MYQRSLKFLPVFIVLLLAAMACNFSASTAKIAGAEMARDSEGADPTTVFAAEDVFFCNVDLQNAPDDTVVKAVWTAVDVEDTDPNTEIDTTEITSGSSILNFQLSNTNLWPSGNYKVDLYLNDKLDRTVEFTVE